VGARPAAAAAAAAAPASASWDDHHFQRREGLKAYSAEANFYGFQSEDFEFRRTDAYDSFGPKK